MIFINGSVIRIVLSTGRKSVVGRRVLGEE
jgi:hypothetical protein